MIRTSFILILFYIGVLISNFIVLPVSVLGNSGASAMEIGRCNVKSCFINILMIHKSEILGQQKNTNGTFHETYRVQREKNLSLEDYIRTVVSSGDAGLWKIVKEPIQGYISDDTNIIFKTTYNEKEEALKIEIQDPV